MATAQTYQPAQAVPPTIQAFDCFHPTDVKTYDISQHCPAADAVRADPHRAEVYILQQDFTHRAPGFRCSMTRGTRRFVCGTFSYEKALRGPVGQLPVSLTGTECHQLVSTREYTDEKKKVHPVKVPGLNEIAVDEIGWESSIDGDQRCQGQRVDIDGHPVDRLPRVHMEPLERAPLPLEDCPNFPWDPDHPYVLLPGGWPPLRPQPTFQ